MTTETLRPDDDVRVAIQLLDTFTEQHRSQNYDNGDTTTILLTRRGGQMSKSAHPTVLEDRRNPKVVLSNQDQVG